MADGDVIKMLVQLEATAQQMIQEINRGDAAVAKTSSNIDRNLSKVDQAFDRVGKNAGTLQQAVSGAFSAIGAGNLAAAGSIAGLAALTSRTMDYAREIKNLSSVANSTPEQFQAMAYGAKTVGIEHEKLADILKDTNERIGEFIQSGSGEMQDFFTKIAPKVGITAQAFKGLSGPDALQLYVNSLQKANLNQQEITKYMEALADEATALYPLLKDNGVAMAEFADQAKKAGLVISSFNIERLSNAKKEIDSLKGVFEGATTQVTLGLLPGIEKTVDALAKFRDNGGAQKLGETIAFLAENVDILVAALGGKLAAAFTKFAIEAVASGYQATKAFVESVAASKAAAIAKAEEAAVSAQAASARLREAAATVTAAQALKAETAARVESLAVGVDMLAYQTQLKAGSADAERYSSALTALEKEHAQAKRQSAKASEALVTANAAAAAAMAQDTAATAANATAQREAAAAKNLLARSGSALLGMFGGPLGLISLAVGAGVALYTMSGDAKRAETSLDELKRSVQDVRKEFLALTRDEQRRKLNSVMDEQAQEAKKASDAYDELKKSLRSSLVGSRSNQEGIKLFQQTAEAMDKARAAGQPLSDILAKAGAAASLPAASIKSLTNQAGGVSELATRVKLLADRQGELQSAMTGTTAATKSNTDTNIEGTQAGQKALEALQKQLATLQDKTAVEAANRVITDNNIDTQSDLAKQLRATAAEIDNQKTADEAARKAKTDASSAASKAASEAERQREALKTLNAETSIAVEKADGLSASYVSGKDNLYQLTLQQRVEQELLKTGAAAREQVTAAVKAQMDAEARRDINKATRDLQTETAALLSQGVATLQGTSALEAYNLERGKSEILAGRNAEALTKETAAYLAAMDQRNQALKISQQLSSVEGIMDRLQPQAKLLRDYTKEVGALTKAMELDKDHSAQYAETLRLLGLEYEQNRVKATAWGQFTEGAVDRVDDAFANAWKNIDQGFDGFATNLKDGFKQLLAELAHMAITKPIVMQIGAALGVGGLSAAQAGGGSGGGLNIVSLAQNAYSVYSGVTGVGSSILAGYQTGGITGAIQGGAGYYGNLVTNAASTVAGWLGLTSAASGAGTAAVLNAAAIAGANSVGAGMGYLGASTLSYTGAAAAAGGAAGAGAAGSTGALAGLGGIASTAWPLAIVAGMYASGKLYSAGVRPDAGAMKDSFDQGGTFGKVLGFPQVLGAKYLEAADKLLGGIVGGKAAAIINGSTVFQAVYTKVAEKLFGGAWQTKDAGYSLGVEGGELDAFGYQQQKRKGGWLKKGGKRTVFNALDEETQGTLDGLFGTGLIGIEDTYKRFGIEITEQAVNGLRVAATQISTIGKTKEEVQGLINGWFTTTFDSITDQLNTATGSQFKSGLTFEGLTTLLNNLITINGMLETLNVGVLKITPAGAYAAEALGALAGGMDKLTENVNGYYGAFFTEAEKQADTLGAINKQFGALGVTLPSLRQGYRDIVSAIDVSTAAGQAMFTSLTSLWQTASSYYDILEAQNKAAKQAQSDMLSGALGTLQRAVQRQQTALSAAYNEQTEGLNSSLSTSQSVVSSLTSMTNGLASALKTLMGQSDAAKAVLYRQAQATLVSAAAIARAGGSIAGLAGIDDALSTVTGNDASRYGNWEDFARDQGRSLVLIDELNSAAGGQLDQAQASVKALQDQIALAKKQYDMESTKLQGQLDLAQAQIDGINGIDNRLLTVNEALAEILAAITKASPNGTGATNADAIIEAAYRAALGRSADASGAAYWKQQLASGAVNSNNLSTAIAAAGAANAAAAPSQIAAAYASTLGRMPTEADMAYWTAQMASGAVTDIGAAIKASAVANGQIPAFANGGSYLGGLALVGERGPEVIDFNRPGYVYNARETAGMLSGADLSGVMGLLAQLLAAVGEGNDHLWFINDRTRATADNTEVLRDQALKEATV